MAFKKLKGVFCNCKFVDNNKPNNNNNNNNNSNAMPTILTQQPSLSLGVESYKVMVRMPPHEWFVFRQYQEFHFIWNIINKQDPENRLILPEAVLMTENEEKLREDLDRFIQHLVSDKQLLKIPEVKEFLQLDRWTRQEKDQSHSGDSSSTMSSSNNNNNTTGRNKNNLLSVNLGPSENKHVKPSDFEFLRVIGNGSFGKVLLARHRVELKYYAVKVLSKRQVLKRDEAKHIMSERNVLLKNLNFPFLVGLHYSFQTPDKLYYVLDYVNGGELFFHLQRERWFQEPRARFYAAEICAALGYLHAHGIIYRDLKPENLLLDAEGHIVLTDFGLSKEGLLYDEQTHTFCGTPEYLAPEVLRKEGYDSTVDWWCLGAVLYEMLYGLPPFYTRNLVDMYDRILNKPIKLKTTVSADARDIMSKLLHKDRLKRLGAGFSGYEDVKRHVFFRPINWPDLLARKITPPFNPNVTDVMDLHNIDPEFTKEVVPPSLGRSEQSNLLTASVQQADNAFAGFSYAPPMLNDIGGNQ